MTVIYYYYIEYLIYTYVYVGRLSLVHILRSNLTLENIVLSYLEKVNFKNKLFLLNFSRKHLEYFKPRITRLKQYFLLFMLNFWLFPNTRGISSVNV